MVEGGQDSIVGLGPVHEDVFNDTHKWSNMCTRLVHKGDNLNRYILGRQFMVILIVFVIERTGSPIEDAELWGFPDWMTHMFLVSGFGMILFTCMVGQLNSEVNGCHCMLDYRSQIAYFAVTKLQKHERGDGYFSKDTCRLLFTDDGHNHNHNLAAFMIGRQLCVVSCMFFSLEEGEENLLGVSDGIQKLFETGLLGALCTAIVGSMMWRLLSSAFPIAFMETPFTYVLLRLCLFLERTGLLHGAWVLAAIHKRVANFHRDEFYIGTAEERAAKKYPDDLSSVHSGPGRLIPILDVGENPVEATKQSVHHDAAADDTSNDEQANDQV